MTSPDTPPAATNVLLIEDHVDTATVIALLLKRYGHRVETAGSIQAGLDAFNAGRYDVVLSDLSLPDGSGLDLITRLRATSRVPAVALTGHGMEDDVRRCTDAGFDAHMTKPVDYAALDALIRRLTGRGG